MNGSAVLFLGYFCKVPYVFFVGSISSKSISAVYIYKFLIKKACSAKFYLQTAVHEDLMNLKLSIILKLFLNNRDSEP